MKRILLGLLLAFLVLALFVSCGKRDNPLRSRYLFRDPWMMSAVEFPALEGSIVSDPYIRNVYAYLPPNYDLVLHQPQLINEGFSVLYLLHDFGVDAESFVNVYKVLQIADHHRHGIFAGLFEPIDGMESGPRAQIQPSKLLADVFRISSPKLPAYVDKLQSVGYNLLQFRICRQLSQNLHIARLFSESSRATDGSALALRNACRYALP